MRKFAIAACWLAILTGWTIGERALGQENPPNGLQPGEVQVRLFLSMTAALKPQPPNDEGAINTATGSFFVEASFAAKYISVSQGKRILRNFRLLSADGIKGDLTETHTYIKPNKVGEGGVTPDPAISYETWEARGVSLSLPQFDIEIDLAAKTWLVREFGDDPQRWFGELSKAQSEVGVQFDFDIHAGKAVWKPILLMPIPTLNQNVLGFAQSDFGNLGQPQPLQGTEGSLGVNLESKRLEGTDSTGDWLFLWEIRDSSPALELRVTAKGYADWRPSVKNYDPDRQFIDPGSPLSVTAQVVDLTGEIPAVHVKELRWILHETSQLPGIAMNYPYQSTDTSWDLSLAKRLPSQDKKQELVEENLTTLKSSVNIYPWDHGGWSTLRVEATLDDGTKLQGKLKGPEGDETKIRLPDRTADSKIHRKWKRAYGIANESDNMDEDNFPSGKKSALGDGFSNFEEYRGFYVSTEVASKNTRKGYVSTTPILRDVFFYDRMKDQDSWAAMRLFVEASWAGAYVLHPGDGFMDESRLMNGNRGAGPTQGAQHAIGIRKPSSAVAWRALAIGDRPRTADVWVPYFSSFESNAPKLGRGQDLYRRNIAQALLSACGVQFPGAGDKDYTLTIKRGADGRPEIKTGNQVVTLRHESGHDEGEDWLGKLEQATSVRRRLKDVGGDKAAESLKSDTRTYYVAEQGGQHSGPLDNIMRDTFAEAYRVGNTIILLPKGHKEFVGSALSITSTSDAQPNRYGDSTRPAPGNEFVPNDHR